MSANGNGNGNAAAEAFTRFADSMINESALNLRRFARLPFLYEKAQRVRQGATPSEVVYEEDGLKLLHYISPQPAKFRTPLVVVFALVNRPYILDLKKGKSVVEHFVNRGFDTYLIDWGTQTDAQR